MSKSTKILYCRCAYSKVVPTDVKKEVLQKLSDSNVSFDAVADLCEMSARKNIPGEMVKDGQPLKIAACYPRAVKWLFEAADCPLPEKDVEVLNMRTESAEDIVGKLLNIESSSEGAQA